MTDTKTTVNPELCAREQIALDWAHGSDQGFDLYVKARDCTDYMDGPGYIRVHVDPAFLAMLSKRIMFCCAEGLYATSERRQPDTCDGLPDTKFVDLWSFHVNKTDFWFKGTTSGVTSTESNAISVSNLELLVKGDPLDTGDDDLFSFYGGCVFYAEDDPEDLLESVLGDHPEVAARQVAIDMEARIRESSVTPDPEATEATSRRRKKVGL